MVKEGNVNNITTPNGCISHELFITRTSEVASLLLYYVPLRAYLAAGGGKRVCNYCSGEM